MSQASGTKVTLGYQVESTYGRMPSSIALKKCYFESEGLQLSWNQVQSNVLGGSRNPKKSTRGNVDLAGPLQTELAPQMGTLIKAAMGTCTTTGAGPYTHTITIGDIPSFTLERGFTDLGIYLLYLGCKCNRMSLSVKPEGMQSLSFDWMGKVECQALKYKTQSGNFTVGNTLTGGTSGATADIMSDTDAGTSGILALYNISGTFTDGEAITDGGTGAAVVDGTIGAAAIDTSYTDNSHTPFDGFSIATIEEGGSAIANVMSVDLSIENNLDGGNYLIGGKGQRGSIPDGKARVSGTLRAMFDSMTLYNKAIKYQESSLRIVYKFGAGTGAAGAEYIEFWVPELVYAPKSPVAQGPTGVSVELPFEAFYDNAAGASALQVILKNTEATI